jgi:hypothetical protein
MQERNTPRHTARLYLVAARLSGILAVIALDSGRLETARAYGTAAFHLAQLVDDANTQSWVRATQSLIEYYAEQYQASLALAVDGLTIAPNGPQAIRLLANGQARALARLGDKAGVIRAVEHAAGLLHQTRPATNVISDSLDLGPYCGARLAANAATAYLHIDEPDQVLVHASTALEAFDAAGVRGPRALTRFDMAVALVQGPRRDLNRAAGLIHEGLSVVGADEFGPVTQRAGEFLTLVGTPRHEPALRPAIEHIRELTIGAP